MRVTASRVYMQPQPVPKMPPGMVELMEGLTRDVLKNNPPDVYEFCANHIQKLLEMRDGPVAKRPMTLEEKITRAQQKVRERAEQRKRQYDKEMLLRSVKSNGKSKAETSEEIIAKPKIEEIDTHIISYPVAESSLKTPVHHGQELNDALEVEICHKPNGDSDKKDVIEDFKLTEDTEERDIKTPSLDESKTTEALSGVNETETPNEKPVAKEIDSKMSEIDGTDKRSSIIEENVIENYKEELPKHILEPRNVEDVTVKTKKSTNEVIQINEKVEQKESVIVETQPDETVTSQQVTEVTEVLQQIYDDKIDDTPIPLVHEQANKSEEIDQEQSNQKELENLIDISAINPQKIDVQNADSDKVTAYVNKSKDLESKDTNDLEANNTVVHNESEEHKVQNTKSEEVKVDNMKESKETENIDIKLNDEIAKTIGYISSDEKINEELKVTNSAVNEHVCDEIYKPKLNENIEEKPHEHYDDVFSIKVDSDAENIEHSDLTKVEAEMQNEIPMGSQEIDQHNGKENGTVELPQNIGSIQEKSHCLKPLAHKESKDTSDTVHTENIDGTVIEDRVLVDELANVKNDNASTPDQNIDIKVNNNKMKIHGSISIDMPNDVTNEDTDRDYLSTSEADSEKQDTDQQIQQDTELSTDMEHTILDLSKRNSENISGGIENTTDVRKSNKESISLGKSNSMEDSAAEDGIVVSDTKTNGKFNNHTNSTSMDLETAAVTIQKVFRTFLFKSRASTFEDSVNDDNNLIDEDSERVDIDLLVPPPMNMKERRGLTRMDTVLQTVNEEKSLSLSTDDSSLSSAATVIQAHVRGFLVRNRLSSNKTASSASLVNSDGLSTSLDADIDQNKGNKTILNIIVPEGGHFLSRDESVLTSMDLSLDGSPTSSVNLHPLGYDKSERRKQLKREDAIQSFSPPSNNSGKLSEDVDSVKEILNNDSTEQQKVIENLVNDIKEDSDGDSRHTTPTKSTTVETVVEALKLTKETSGPNDELSKTIVRRGTLTKLCSDECDVVTPFEVNYLTDSDNTSGLLHSGEFHDVVLPTKISRSDTSVVREFKNVLAYFLIWNNA